MTEYAVWYVSAGAVFYVVFYAFVGRKRSAPDTDLWANFVAGLSGDKPLSDKLLNGLFAPFVAVVLLLLAWPWAAWTAVSERGTRDADPVAEGPKEFAVLDEYLVCELPLGDIECWETVDDPLGAAPKLPFGHLNAAWNDFKAGSGNGTFWKFSGKHVGDWDMEWLREGYAALKEDGTRPHFLTRLEFLGRADERERK